jgi:hypothetical protein
MHAADDRQDTLVKDAVDMSQRVEQARVTAASDHDQPDRSKRAGWDARPAIPAAADFQKGRLISPHNLPLSVFTT